MALGLARAFSALTTLFFPSHCAFCGALLHGVDSPVLCRACLSRLIPLAAAGRTLCPRCSLPRDEGCACICDDAGYAFRMNRSLFLFDEDVRALIHLMKYAHRKTIATLFGKKLALAYPAYIKAHDILLPVPLGRRRRRERGYNQSTLIAQRIARETGVPVCEDALVRRRETQALATTHSGDERRAIIKGAFHVRKGKEGRIRGKRVLVLDDVMTTGTTLHEVAHVLLCEGDAGEVNTLTVARA